MLNRRSVLISLPCAIFAGTSRGLAQSTTPQRALEIARDTFVYGYPMVANYGTMFADAIDKGNPKYKAPFNEIAHEARSFAPQDVPTINVDTADSYLWADLRSEPLVLSCPAIEKQRYYSIQFVDLYTWDFAYEGTRLAGNGAAKILLVGPGWSGKIPRGVAKVIRSDTQFAFAVYRTQVLGPDDVANVRKIQAGFTVQPLSRFIGQPPPPSAPPVDFPRLSLERAKSLAFFDYLSFILQFCPSIPADEKLRAYFGEIGVEPGATLGAGALSTEMRMSMQLGMKEGLKAIEAYVAAHSGADLFGTRLSLKNDYLQRAGGAMVGLYGDPKKETCIFSFFNDAAGSQLDGTSNRYTLHFDKDRLPAVKGFWELTLYDGRSKCLNPNPSNRYVINSRMLPSLGHDTGGGLTIYLQSSPPPAKPLEANWLPTPHGSFFLLLRCHWPDAPIVEGKWLPPDPVIAD